MTDMPREDLYDLIELASKRQAAKQDRLTEAEVDAIAEELGIDPAYIDQAQHELARIRTKHDHERARRRKLLKVTLIGIGVFLVILGWLGIAARGSLLELLTEVDRAKAQLVNVMERQKAVQKRLSGAPESRGKAAELAGAENRVRIQRKRYDESATAYNGQATGFLNSIWCTVFTLPSAVPLSNEPHFIMGGESR